MIDPKAIPLNEDLLEGAEEIARYLGGKWNANRVYIAKRHGHLPIRTKPGMGLYAFRSELSAFLKTPDSLCNLG